MSAINWAAVHPNNENRPAVPVATPYTPGMEEDLAALAGHLVTDHGYQPEDVTRPDMTPAQTWAMLERLHWSALVLSAPVAKPTPGGPA